MRPLGATPPTPQGEDLTPSDAEVVPLNAPRLLPATDSRFKGLKAFVAGAAGRTGRRVVARLVEEGVPVRALVRNAIKAVRDTGAEQHGIITDGGAWRAQTPLLMHVLNQPHTHAQVEVLPGLDKNVEIIEGDVYKFQTLPSAMEGWYVYLAVQPTRVGWMHHYR